MPRTRPVAPALAALSLSIALTGCTGQIGTDTHILAIAERDNATPAIASRGHDVVVAWSATASGRPTEIVAAVSADGGGTFGAPVKVNDDVAEVRASGEQAPRVSFVGDRIAIVWTARREGASEIRVSWSSDRGRTFSPSVLAHAPGLTGMRGWAAATGDSDRLRVVWLDGRNAAPAAHGAAHVHGAPGSASPRQDLFGAEVTPDGVVREFAIASNVCFCCKTSVVADGGAVDVAWRHIFPSSMRDIGFVRLTPASDGNAEPAIVRVSEDRWHIEACPDDGPSMVSDRGTRRIVWPTLIAGAETQKGIFYADTADGRTFSARQRLDEGDISAASHPQLAASAHGIAAVWDERSGGSVRVRIRRRPANTQSWTRPETLSDASGGYYPAIAAMGDGWLVAWTSVATPRSKIEVRRR